MPWTAPFHSTSDEDKEVYHNNSACADGKRILAANKASGDAGRPLCEECDRLNREGK
jgi:hypothetical protein